MRTVQLPRGLADRPDWAVEVIATRCALGLSQRQLADRAGIFQDQLSKYETGRWNPGPKMRARIAAALAEIETEF